MGKTQGPKPVGASLRATPDLQGQVDRDGVLLDPLAHGRGETEWKREKLGSDGCPLWWMMPRLTPVQFITDTMAMAKQDNANEC